MSVSSRNLVETFHENGKKKSECEYIDGEVPVGPYKEWYPDGTLKFSYVYKNQLLNGPYEHYDIYGNLSIQCTYERGVIKGLCKNYINGFCTHTTYVNGRKHGPLLLYDNFGKLVFQCQYNLNSLEGPFKKWYPSCNKDIENPIHIEGTLCNPNYHRGSLNLGSVYGDFKEWYPNGQLHLSGFVHYDLSFSKDNDFISFFPNGQMYFKYTASSSTFESWFENGKIRVSCVKNNDSYSVEEWNEDGTPLNFYQVVDIFEIFDFEHNNKEFYGCFYFQDNGFSFSSLQRIFEDLVKVYRPQLNDTLPYILKKKKNWKSKMI